MRVPGRTIKTPDSPQAVYEFFFLASIADYSSILLYHDDFIFYEVYLESRGRCLPMLDAWNKEHPLSDEDLKLAFRFKINLREMMSRLSVHSINLTPRTAQPTIHGTIYSAATLKGILWAM